MSRKCKRKIVLTRTPTVFVDSGCSAPLKSLAIGLYSIRAYCLANPKIHENYDIAIKHFEIGTTAEDIARGIAEEEPFIAGFSSYASDYETRAEITAALKKISPDTIIVTGGPQFYEAGEQLLHNESIDIVVPFEGEIPFEELLIGYINGSGPASARGLAYRDADGIHFTGAVRKRQPVFQTASRHYRRKKQC